jgi:phosphoglycerol transferase MdoB-like AlkP superfamily enzyme
MRHRIFLQAGVLSLFFLALIFALQTVHESYFLEKNEYFLVAIIFLSALALSWRAAAFYMGGWILIFITVIYLNDAKVSLTAMPLTFLDLRIALANPSGFAGAMKIPSDALIAVASSVAVVALCIFYWRLSHLRWQDIRENIFPRAVAGATAGLLASISLTMFAQRLEAAVMAHEYSEIANMPDGLLLIAKKVGAVPFLILTARYDASTASPFRKMAKRDMGTPAPGRLPAYMNPLKKPERFPDIVVLLLESTFNLPKVFDATPELRSDLFPYSSTGQLQGELGVNAIGGGTWISEFEAITGIPSRLFGYAGYYTHVALAPYVKASLATYLRAKGYKTLGLYSVEGKFYGARVAYARYGFESFYDGDDLKIEKPWYAADTDIVAKYIDVVKRSDPAAPLFAFALTMENHSPHPCTRFGSEAEMPYRFVGQANARATCELNEYIARYRSTETAVLMLETALRERQKATGRPYVLAIFGDHQPNSFTGTAKTPFLSPNDYSKLRRGSNDVTFYQIRSSMPSPFAVKSLDASVIMLPTLVSAYVATAADDIYLPANFNIQARCGETIALPRLNSAYGMDAMIPEGQPNSGAPLTPLPRGCDSALIEARTDYNKLIEMP